MCRLLGYCSRDRASLAYLLGGQGLSDFTALSALHRDGWGMAWYDGPEPVIRKSAGRADSEPEYDKLAWQPLSDLGLLHLRWATPGLAVSDRNSHPFRYGPYVLAHNGAIHPQERLGELLPPQWERRLTGTTDSERYFLHLMWRLAERDGDMVAAIADTTADIEHRYAPNSLNAILLAPDKLYAISWYDPAKVPEQQLRQRGYGDRPDEIAAYFDLAYRATAGAVVVASSGWPMPGWTPLPRGHVLVTDRSTLHTSVIPLTARGAASLVLAGGPAVASTHSVQPGWFTGLEVVHGQLHGRAAWIQASKRNPRLPVRFRGVVRTHGVVSLGSSKSRAHSVRTPVGWFTVKGISQHTRAKIVSRASCRLAITVTSRLVMRPRKSTGVFRGATGRGVVRVRFAFNYHRHHNGKCNFGNNAVPKKHGGVIAFRLVMPRLTVR